MAQNRADVTMVRSMLLLLLLPTSNLWSRMVPAVKIGLRFFLGNQKIIGEPLQTRDIVGWLGSGSE